MSSGEQPRIVVTGGAGFIGSHVADRLLGFGHEVLIVDNLASGSRANIPSSAQFGPPSNPGRFTSHTTPGLPLVVHRPEDVLGYPFVDQLDMTHSGLCYFKMAWEAVGGYQPDKKKRVTPFSDRDFQLRVGALWPVAVATGTPLAFWRNDSSVDAGCNS